MGHQVIDRLPNLLPFCTLTWLFTDEETKYQCVFGVEKRGIHVDFYTDRQLRSGDFIHFPIETGVLEKCKAEFNRLVTLYGGFDATN
jgi:hypothetical protein